MESFLVHSFLSRTKAKTLFMENGFLGIFGAVSPYWLKMNMWVTSAVGLILNL